jgi:hypothetical protein
MCSQTLAEAREILENLPVFEENEIDYREVRDVEQVKPQAFFNQVEDGFLLRNRGLLKILFFFFVVIPLVFGLLVALFNNFKP